MGLSPGAYKGGYFPHKKEQGSMKVFFFSNVTVIRQWDFNQWVHKRANFILSSYCIKICMSYAENLLKYSSIPEKSFCLRSQ